MARPLLVGMAARIIRRLPEFLDSTLRFLFLTQLAVVSLAYIDYRRSIHFEKDF